MLTASHFAGSHFGASFAKPCTSAEPKSSPSAAIAATGWASFSADLVHASFEHSDGSPLLTGAAMAHHHTCQRLQGAATTANNRVMAAAFLRLLAR